MKKFRLSRKRKKKYKKDLVKAFYTFWAERLIEAEKEPINEKSLGKIIGCILLLLADPKKVCKSEYKSKGNVRDWQQFYFPRRLDVNIMKIILNEPETGKKCKKTGKWVRYDKPIINKINDEGLLEWYKKYYPNDKLAHHFCKQNRYKWSKYVLNEK